MRFSSKEFAQSVGAFLLAGFCMLAMPRAAQAGFDFDERGGAFLTGQAVITFKPGTTLITAKSILARYGADPSKIQFVDDQSAVVKFDDRTDVLSFCRQMSATGWATASCPNYLHSFFGIPSSEYYSLQWGLQSGTAGASATVGADFQGAWSYVPNATVPGAGVKIGVLDSGVDYSGSNPQLKMLPNGPILPNVFPYAGIWAPPPGVRTLAQVDALPSGSTSYLGVPYVYGLGAPLDDVGHGTHVTGIIAARRINGTGVAGGAPASIIYPIKIGNRLLGSITDTIIGQGIRFAATNGCRVINMSFGGATMGQVVTNAIQFAQTQFIDRTIAPNINFKGVVCVAAMGNDTTPDFNSKFGGFYPAVLPGVVAVGAHNPDGTPASYSTPGAHITIAAPGGDGGALSNHSGEIFSTYPGYAYADIGVSMGPPILPSGISPTTRGYSYMSGTSMSAAHATAAAALLLQKKPYLSQAQVWAQLAMFSTHTAPNDVVTNQSGLTTTIPDSAWEQTRGYGLLNANSLVQGKLPPGSVTGIPHVFPFSPRNQIASYAPGFPITNVVFNGLDTIDVVRAGLPSTFRVTVVDDKGERIPNATVTARFRLLAWNGPWGSAPLGFPTSNVVDTAMLDTGTAAQDDLLLQDCVYGCRVLFPGSASNCLYEVRYLVSAPGMRSNTNAVVNVRVQ